MTLHGGNIEMEWYEKYAGLSSVKYRRKKKKM